MNIKSFRSPKVIVPTLAAVAVFGVGGVVYANTAGADELKGDELDRASAAAIEAVGGGQVTETDKDDDGGVVVYEVEVTQDDGRQFDVDLDENYDVVGQPQQDGDDDRDDSDDRYDDDRGDDRGDRDADDRMLSEQERTQAEEAALAAVPGTVTDVEASDDRGEAYEVEVVTKDGVEWTIGLDADFGVVDRYRD